MGGSSGGDNQIITPPPPNPQLQEELTNAGRAQLAANDQFNPFGSGPRLTPLNPFAQVYFPGQQQTIYGQAGFNPANSQPFFGQSAVNQATGPQNMGFNSQLQGQGGYSGLQQLANNPNYPNAQQVMAPLQQFYPGIIPQFGVPQAYGGGQTGGSGQAGGGQSAPQPQPQPQAQAQQQQPQGQSQQGNSQPQPPDQQKQPSAPAQQAQPDPQQAQQEAMARQFLAAIQAAGAYYPTNFQNGVFT